MKRLIGICFLAGAAAAAAFTDRPWGAAQAQQGGDAPRANYELGQIQQSFSAAAELYPTHQGVPLAQLIKDESGPPLADLGKAIERKNNADFARAF